MGNSFHVIDGIVLFAYLGLMVGLGFYFSRFESSTERFFVGGRKLPWWAVGLSIFATQLSAITYIAIPGKAYQTDWAWVIVNLGIPFAGLMTILFFLPVYRQKAYTSIYEYLEDRFGPETRAYGALAFILMQIGRVAIVLYLPSIVLAEVTGLPLLWMIGLMGVLVTVYTVLGGIEAVIWTDVIQAVVLLFGAVAALLIIIGQLDGGFSHLVSAAQQHDKFHMVHWDSSKSSDLIWIMIVGALFSHLVPYTSDQTVVQRYFTTSGEREARRCLWLGVWIAIPATFLFFFVGTALYVFYLDHPDRLGIDLSQTGYDRVFPYFIVHQMPVGMTGLLIAAIFAGSMSSLDSSLNSIATVCVTDFYQRFLHPESSDRQRLRLAKIATIVAGAFATIAALWVAETLTGNPDSKGTWNLFIAVQGLLGGVLAGIFCAGVFTKRCNQAGAVTALVLGTAFLAIVKYELNWHAQTFAMAGIVSSFAVCYGMSRLAPMDENRGLDS